METLDDLLIKRRRGALTAAEERRLGSALRASREYELALLAHEVFDRDGEPRAGDAERLRELVDAVERRSAPAPRARRAWRVSVGVGVPLLLAGVAAAALGVSRSRPIEVTPARPAPVIHEAPVSAPPVSAPPVSARHGSSLTQPAAERAPNVAPPSTHVPGRRIPLRRSPPVTALPAPSAPAHASLALEAPPPARDESAQSLFRRANRLRQSDWPAAADLYLELTRRFPTSNEASVSEVALGKWSLAQGRSGDALEWFRAHQRRPPGALSAEALFGEARALESIGSHAAARAPWQRLLERYPDSPYANVARQRLGP